MMSTPRRSVASCPRTPRGLRSGPPPLHFQGSYASKHCRASAWRSALAPHRPAVRPRLGCGLGVVGILAALAGADVLLLDREPLALHCAAATAELQGLQVAELSGAAPAVRAAVYDWVTSQPLGFEVDVVLAAEVLYDPSEAFQVAQALLRLLKRPLSGCHVMITDPRSPCRSVFVARAWTASKLQAWRECRPTAAGSR